MAATPEVVALASLRRYCNRYLTRATWRETWRGTRFAARGTGPGFVLLLRESPLVSVASVTADGRSLGEGVEYVVDWDRANVWLAEQAFVASEIVAEYVAGYEPLADDLQWVIDQVVVKLALPPDAEAGTIASVDMPDVGGVRYIDAGEALGGAGLLPAFAPWLPTINAYRDTSRLWRMPTASRLERVEPARDGV